MLRKVPARAALGRLAQRGAWKRPTENQWGGTNKITFIAGVGFAPSVAAVGYAYMPAPPGGKGIGPTKGVGRLACLGLYILGRYPVVARR